MIVTTMMKSSKTSATLTTSSWVIHRICYKVIWFSTDQQRISNGIGLFFGDCIQDVCNKGDADVCFERLLSPNTDKHWSPIKSRSSVNCCEREICFPSAVMSSCSGRRNTSQQLCITFDKVPPFVENLAIYLNTGIKIPNGVITPRIGSGFQATIFGFFNGL